LGALNVQHATALGSTANGVTVASGGALELQGGVTISGEALSLNGTGVGGAGALRNISGNNTWGGQIVIGAGGATIASASGVLTLDVASGNGMIGTDGVTFDGAGTINVLDPIALTTAAGTVTIAGWNGGYGKMVEVDHGNGFATRYAHLSQIDVEVGQPIRIGQIVGKVGSTGRSTGPHLHYETRVDGDAVDPQKFLRAGVRLGGAL